jgi:hypothetical protein
VATHLWLHSRETSEQRAPSTMVTGIYLPFVGQQFVNHTMWLFFARKLSDLPDSAFDISEAC